MSLPPFDGTGWIDGMPGLPGGGTPALSIVLVVAPTGPTAGTPVNISATASADPPDPVTLHYTLNGGAPQTAGALNETTPTTFSQIVDTTLLVPGSVYDVWVTSGATESNHVTVTIAATVAALTEFAVANSLEVPAGAKKAELLALVQDSGAGTTELTFTSTEEN